MTDHTIQIENGGMTDEDIHLPPVYLCWRHYEGDAYWDMSFGRIEGLGPVIEAARQEGVLRVLEIGTNDGNSIHDVYNWLHTQIPTDLPVEMHFVDIQDFAPEELLLPQTPAGNFKFVYHANTDATCFIMEAIREGTKFGIIYGFGVENLIDYNSFVLMDTAFVLAIKGGYQQILLPGGYLMFVPGHRKEAGNILPENVCDTGEHKSDMNVFERYVPN